MDNKSKVQALLTLAILCLAIIGANSLMSQELPSRMERDARISAMTKKTLNAPLQSSFTEDEQTKRRLKNRNLGYGIVGAFGLFTINNEGNDAPAVVVVSLTGIVALADNLITNNKKQ